MPLIEWGKTNKGNTEFVYGVSDSIYGSLGYEYRKGNIKAKRGWFLFDDEIVCLVAGLQFNSNNDLYQSVNQSLSMGDVWINNQKMIGNEYYDKNIEKVYHNSVGYIFDASTYTNNLQAL